MVDTILEIKGLEIAVEGKAILKGLDLTVKKGEIHVIMGPNGAGKSTLANGVFNNPHYEKVGGSVILQGEDITHEKTNEIAKRGVFMSFQSPEEINGISVLNFLKTAKGAITGENVKLFAFKKALEGNMRELEMNEEYSSRDLNVGFSGGEKKKNEILQMLMLCPTLSILDETDSGLDVDAIRTVSKGIDLHHNEDNAVIIITHNTKLLQQLDVNYVHVLVDGRIVKTGTSELAELIEKDGFAAYMNGGEQVDE